MDQEVFIFAVHVHPGTRHPGVGGLYGDHLVVRVRSRAVNGAANEEVLTSLAGALAVPRRDVSFVRTTRSRDKLIAVLDSATVRLRYQTLRETLSDGDATP
jgi:uncharacterized protein YggU (UPF0235/DUF167 family)